MRKIWVSDGKAYVTDERWITIGGEDEDGSGQHVLIKENGTIVAGFGAGKNVKNVFNKEGGSEKSSDKYESKARESVEYWLKTHYKTESDKNIKESVESVRSQMEYRLKSAEKNLRDAKGTGKPELIKKFQDKYDEAKGMLDALNKYYDGGTTRKADTPEKANEAVAKKKQGLPPLDMPKTPAQARKMIKSGELDLINKRYEEEAGNTGKANKAVKNKYSEYGGYTPPEFHGTKEEIFKQATENAKKIEAEKKRREKAQARKTLKDIDKRIAQAKADGDGKRVIFLEATKNGAQKTLNPSTPKDVVEKNIRRAQETQDTYEWRNGRNKDIRLNGKSGGKYKIGGFYYAKNPYAGKNVQSPGTLVGWTDNGEAILYNRRHGRWTATVENLDKHN